MIWSLLFCLIMRRDDLGSMIECHKLEKGEVGFGSIEFKRQFFQKTQRKEREPRSSHWSWFLMSLLLNHNTLVMLLAASCLNWWVIYSDDDICCWSMVADEQRSFYVWWCWWNEVCVAHEEKNYYDGWMMHHAFAEFLKQWRNKWEVFDSRS